jgi:nicotinate-nucleotide adenylyltransferase
MISRLGVFGGMFDPVHLGHINAALYAQELLSLDCIKLVPCNQPNHRAKAFAAAAHRVQMLELAVADYPGIEVDSIEIQRGGVSYAVETLEQFCQSRVAEHLVFLLGIDAFNTLNQWYQWESLLGFCNLLVLSRDNAVVDTEVSVAVRLETRRVEQPHQLFDSVTGNIYIDHQFQFDSSSTQVRNSIESNSDLDDLLHSTVINYIHENQLYDAQATGISNAGI